MIKKNLKEFYPKSLFVHDLSFLDDYIRVIDLNDVRELYIHKWVKIKDKELFVKYVYENHYNVINWMNYVFLGRDRNGNYCKVSIKKTRILEELEKEIEII